MVSRSTKRVTAADIVEFIHTYCFVPEGPYVGQPLRLLPWQQDWIRSVYDNPRGTRRALLSVARKNGKTALIACLALAHVCGPPAHHRPNSQVYSAAQSRDQAALVFHLASKMVRMNPHLNHACAIKETAKELHCLELGTRYKALSAEATTAYGLHPALVIFDELGQVRGPRSALYEALETATGAQQDPLTIIISTQAPNDNDLLSILIDDALAGHDPRVICRLYTAPLEADSFDVETIKLANPAFDDFMNPVEVLAMAADAQRMPAREAEFRNLVLNQRCDTSAPFVAPNVWKACGDPPGSLEGVPVYGGLDLSEVSDLTALVLVGFRDGKWRVRPTFWLPEEGLAERAVADHIPYDLWRDQGLLEVTPGHTVSYEFVANHMRQLFGRYSIRKIGFDMWNFRHLKPWLLKAGMSEQFIAEHWVEFGQGVKSMSPALRELEQIVLDRKLAHGDHPVLSMCMANTTIVRDDAGNRKPSKKRSRGRIDGTIALLMAVGVAPLQSQLIDVEALIG